MDFSAGGLQVAINAIYIVFAVFAILGVIRGMRKGLYKSIADVIFVVLETAVSFVLARLISRIFTDIDKFNSLLDSLKGFAAKSETIVEYIEKIQEYSNQLAEADGVVNLAMALPVVIICPILFCLIYILVGAIFKIPKLLIERLLFGSNGGVNYKGGNRLLGGVVGGVRNVLSLAILIIPIIGFANIPGMITDAAKDAKPLEDGTTASYTEYIKSVDEDYIEPVTDNVIIKTIYNCGGKWAFNSLSTVKVDGVKVSLTNDLCTLAKAESYASYFYGVPVADYGKEQSDMIEKIKDTVNESEVVPTLISGTLSYVSRTWLDGGEIFGYGKLDVGEYYQPTFDELLGIFAELDTLSAKEDIDTVAKLAEITIDSGLLRECTIEGGNVIGVLSSEKFMTDLVLELYDNVRMRTFLEMGSNTFTNYIYKLYDNVNGTETAWCEQIDLDVVSREEMRLEAVRLANIISSVQLFMQTVNTDDSGTIDFTSTFLNSDVGALGRALDLMKNSIIFGNSYQFIIEAILRSESCAELGIINDDFIQLVLDKDSKLENLLVTRQHMAKLAASVDASENTEEAISEILKNLTPEDAELLKKTLTPDIFEKFGMSSDESNVMSKTFNSVIDGITNTGEISDEKIEKEVQAVDNIVNVVKAATSNSEANIFSTTPSEESESGITADELVSSIMESDIITAAVKSVSKDEEGNEVEDPYGISSTLGEEDKQAASDAIKNYYTENKTEENDEGMKDTLSSIAAILGIDTTDLF